MNTLCSVKIISTRLELQQMLTPCKPAGNKIIYDLDCSNGNSRMRGLSERGPTLLTTLRDHKPWIDSISLRPTTFAGTAVCIYIERRGARTGTGGVMRPSVAA